MSVYRLEELCEITSSKRIFAHEYKETGIPFYRSKEVIELANNSDISDKIFISEERFDELNTKYGSPKKGDILLSAIGANLGVPYFVDTDEKFYFKDGNIIWFKNFSTKIDSEYLFWLMNTNLFFEQFTAKSIGAAQKALTIDSLKKYIVDVPDSLEEQRKKIKILKLIKKIINNCLKQNKTIDNQLSFLYKTYFLQENVSNKYKYEYNSNLKRMIPINWKVENLYECSFVEIIKPGVDCFETKNYLATSNINGFEIKDGEWINYENRESRANMLPVKNSIWFAKMKNSIKHLTITESDDWFVNKYILSTGFLGIKCEKKYLSYVHCFINSRYFEMHKDRLAHGTTQEAINNQDLKKIYIVIPDEVILNKFNKSSYALLQLKMSNINKIHKLNKIKDKLLPLFINGQLKVK